MIKTCVLSRLLYSTLAYSFADIKSLARIVHGMLSYLLHCSIFLFNKAWLSATSATQIAKNAKLRTRLFRTHQTRERERERERETKWITKPECHSSHLPEVGDPWCTTRYVSWSRAARFLRLPETSSEPVRRQIRGWGHLCWPLPPTNPLLQEALFFFLLAPFPHPPSISLSLSLSLSLRLCCPSPINLFSKMTCSNTELRDPDTPTQATPNP